MTDELSLDSNEAGAKLAGLLASDWANEHIRDDVMAVSFRIPRNRVRMMDAMAKKGGVSRNSMCCQLLAVGIQDVLSRLPDEVVGEIHELLDESLGDEGEV